MHPLLGEDAKDAPPDLTGLMKACSDFLAEYYGKLAKTGRLQPWKG